VLRRQGEDGASRYQAAGARLLPPCEQHGPSAGAHTAAPAPAHRRRGPGGRSGAQRGSAGRRRRADRPSSPSGRPRRAPPGGRRARAAARARAAVLARARRPAGPPRSGRAPGPRPAGGRGTGSDRAPRLLGQVRIPHAGQQRPPALAVEPGLALNRGGLSSVPTTRANATEERPAGHGHERGLTELGGHDDVRGETVGSRRRSAAAFDPRP
jgi:hypothetical protein